MYVTPCNQSLSILFFITVAGGLDCFLWQNLVKKKTSSVQYIYVCRIDGVNNDKRPTVA